MAQNRTMQQKNLTNRKRIMREVRDNAMRVAEHEFRDSLDTDMNPKPSWVGRRVGRTWTNPYSAYSSDNRVETPEQADYNIFKSTKMLERLYVL